MAGLWGTAVQIFREYNVDGESTSGKKRPVKAEVRGFLQQLDLVRWGQTAGAGVTWTLDTTQDGDGVAAQGELKDRMLIGFRAHATPAIEAGVGLTLNVDGLGAVEVKHVSAFGLRSLLAGDITGGGKYLAVYTVSGGPYWSLLNPAALGRVLARSAVNTPMTVDRWASDGTLVSLRREDVQEGAISVSGNTVSYGTFVGHHWSQMRGRSAAGAGAQRQEIWSGTVVESVDEMCEWDGPGEKENMTLAKFKVSDTVRARAVYGVFMQWDEDGDALIAGLGAYHVRVNALEEVERGDLLESAGDGTAQRQAEAAVCAHTIGKVVSAEAQWVYADGSYLVPCVLYCG